MDPYSKDFRSQREKTVYEYPFICLSSYKIHVGCEFFTLTHFIYSSTAVLINFKSFFVGILQYSSVDVCTVTKQSYLSYSFSRKSKTGDLKFKNKLNKN